MESFLRKYYNNNNEEWVNEKDQYHRLNGPAIKMDGYKAWGVENKFHRLNGPARTFKGAKNIWNEWHIRLSISYDPIMDNA